MKRFRNILYFAHGASTDCPALSRAVSLADRNDARLTVVDVIEEFDSDPNLEKQLGVNIHTLLHDNRLQSLATLVEPYQRDTERVILTQVMHGTAFVEVIKAVMRNDYDLVIKSMRPPSSLSERLLGSTDLHLLRKCPCPVWIDRPGKPLPYTRIVAAVDPLSEEGESDKIMQLSTSLADREGAALEVVHAWQLAGESILRSGHAHLASTEVDMLVGNEQQRHSDAFDKLLGRYGLSLEDPGIHLVEGQPAPSILKYSEQADLVVMGTVGRTGIPGFIIGNTAEEVLSSTQASILAVKPDSYRSPLA